MAKRKKAPIEERWLKEFAIGLDPIAVTRELVEEVKLLAGYGMHVHLIWDYLRITREQWFAAVREYPQLAVAVNTGRAAVVKELCGILLQKARDGNVTAVLAYLKAHAGFNEKLQIEANPGAVMDLTINVNDPVEAARIYQQIMQGS